MAESEPDSEILEFAISHEVESYHFYMALSKVVDSTDMREILEDFANEELEHKAKLELEMMKLGLTLPIEKELPPPREKSYIISDTNALLNMDLKDILLLAIEKESASFRTYVNFAAHAIDETSRDMFLAIAEEEVKHKQRFQAEYDLITKKELG